MHGSQPNSPAKGQSSGTLRSSRSNSPSKTRHGDSSSQSTRPLSFIGHPPQLPLPGQQTGSSFVPRSQNDRSVSHTYPTQSQMPVAAGKGKEPTSPLRRAKSIADRISHTVSATGPPTQGASLGTHHPNLAPYGSPQTHASPSSLARPGSPARPSSSARPVSPARPSARPSARPPGSPPARSSARSASPVRGSTQSASPARGSARVPATQTLGPQILSQDLPSSQASNRGARVSDNAYTANVQSGNIARPPHLAWDRSTGQVSTTLAKNLEPKTTTLQLQSLKLVRLQMENQMENLFGKVFHRMDSNKDNDNRRFEALGTRMEANGVNFIHQISELGMRMDDNAGKVKRQISDLVSRMNINDGKLSQQSSTLLENVNDTNRLALVLASQMNDSNNLISKLTAQMEAGNHLITELQAQIKEVNHLTTTLGAQVEDEGGRLAVDVEAKVGQVNQNVLDLFQHLENTPDLAAQVEQVREQIVTVVSRIDESNRLASERGAQQVEIIGRLKIVEDGLARDRQTKSGQIGLRLSEVSGKRVSTTELHRTTPKSPRHIGPESLIASSLGTRSSPFPVSPRTQSSEVSHVPYDYRFPGTVSQQTGVSQNASTYARPAQDPAEDTDMGDSVLGENRKGSCTPEEAAQKVAHFETIEKMALYKALPSGNLDDSANLVWLHEIRCFEEILRRTEAEGHWTGSGTLQKMRNGQSKNCVYQVIRGRKGKDMPPKLVDGQDNVACEKCSDNSHPCILVRPTLASPFEMELILLPLHESYRGEGQHLIEDIHNLHYWVKEKSAKRSSGIMAPSS
jgi:hypothetical protein